MLSPRGREQVVKSCRRKKSNLPAEENWKVSESSFLPKFAVLKGERKRNEKETIGPWPAKRDRLNSRERLTGLEKVSSDDRRVRKGEGEAGSN